MESTSEGEEGYRALQIIGKSWRILKSKPVLFIPQIILIGIEYTGGLFFSASLIPIVAHLDYGNYPYNVIIPRWFWIGLLGWSIVVLVANAWIGGVYPLLVRNVVEEKTPKITDAFKDAWHRLPSLLGAVGLICLIILGCSLLSIIPDIGAFVALILLCFCAVWIYHFTPAIMLDNKHAVESIGASKSFSSGKGWSIFGIILFTFGLPFLIGLGLFLLLYVVGLVGLGLYLCQITGFVIGLLFTTLGAIMPTYGYLKYKKPTGEEPKLFQAPPGPEPVHKE